MKVFDRNSLALEKAAERIALICLMRRKRRSGLSVIPLCAGDRGKKHTYIA